MTKEEIGVARPTTGEPVSVGRVQEDKRRPLRVVVGVDPRHPIDPVIQMLNALAPAELELHLVHAFVPDEQTDSTLNDIRTALTTAGLGGTWIEQHPDPVRALIKVAEEQSADLIAIGAPATSEGKIAKGLLARSPVSLLIVRNAREHPKGLTAVLATDHSDYMDSCLAALREMHPTGFEEIVVLTANEVHVGTAALLVNGLPQLAAKAEGWITEKIEEENRNVCLRLAPLGAKCRAMAREGYPSEVIQEVMKETDADLLILGAPPHCLIERLAYGSVSYEEVINRGYSVLALRKD